MATLPYLFMTIVSTWTLLWWTGLWLLLLSPIIELGDKVAPPILQGTAAVVARKLKVFWEILTFFHEKALRHKFDTICRPQLEPPCYKNCCLEVSMGLYLLSLHNLPVLISFHLIYYKLLLGPLLDSQDLCFSIHCSCVSLQKFES